MNYSLLHAKVVNCLYLPAATGIPQLHCAVVSEKAFSNKKYLALVSNLEMSHHIYPFWNGLITIRKMLLVQFAHLKQQQISNLPPYTSTFMKTAMAPSNSLEPLKRYFTKSIRISFNFETCSLKHGMWRERKYFWVFWSLKINFLEVNRLTSTGCTLIASGLHYNFHF